MMYQSLGHSSVSNITITSIIYLLQTAGESLQEIQVSTSIHTHLVCTIMQRCINNRCILKIMNTLSILQYDNHQLYCPDYEEDIQTLVAIQTYGVESVFRTLYERNEYDWSRDSKYPELFNSSRHIQYRNGSIPLCQYYMSMFTTMIKNIY